MSEHVGAAERLKSRRKYGVAGIALIAVIAGAIYGSWYFIYGRYFVETDDAYVNGDTVRITSEIAARVLTVCVDDTQVVHAGETLLELDSSDAEVAMEAARQDLARAVRQVSRHYAELVTLQARILEREAALRRAEGDLQRRQSAQSPSAISAEERAHARDDLVEARAALETARGQLAEARTITNGVDVRHHPDVLAAAARVRDAALVLHRARIIAPVDGVIVQRYVQPGQRVTPGAPLMAVIPLDDVWVDANFKEIQLSDVRVGQPVTVRVDYFGDGAVFHGRIAGFSAGTGAAFALMPAQNATGNWIKIVQRLPVRIALDPSEIKEHPLRIGLSASATVDLRGSVVESVPLRSNPPVSLPSAADSAATQEIIDTIINTNVANAYGETQG